jgi:ribulose-phosphate 3-epimerase
VIRIAPSILAADPAALGAAAAAVEGEADLLHFDAMDGHFVPNLTFGPAAVAALARATSVPLDVHLMLAAPERLVPEFARAGAAILTVHVEACPHLHRVIQQIKECGARAGVALNPATPLAAVEPILPELDLLLVMTVNPGFGGQQLIPGSLGRIAAAARMIGEAAGRCDLEVDGGVTEGNARALAQAGATVLVAGTAVYGTADPRAAIRRLRAAAA